MELMNYLISMLIIGIAFQFGQLWIVIGIALILMVASKDLKVSLYLALSVFVLFYLNGIGMNDYWLFAMIALVILGYLIGLGKETHGGEMADPYAGLLGGGMGM